ncbi:NF-kappa-B inhibitor zeta isoform X2 [Betta splendens]|uniref:NF-kappa-B inhibitor zeta isoform X2 n=1 Tax=Betta splendens TaxID=158456 RepID=A0A9W2Y6P5_BETSP|nr:NF-kappa-B inhibitor zeta isoform X2 [Betta splendens]
MKGRCKIKGPIEVRDESADIGASLYPSAFLPAEPNAPVAALTASDMGGRNAGTRRSINVSEKVYLGVRVKMPVRDLLRNIRLAKGSDSQDLKDGYSKTAKGDKKRVKTCRAKGKHLRKSLEELAIIVEVLEEDLRTCSAECNSEESGEIIPSPESYVSYSTGKAKCHQVPSPSSFLHTSIPPSSFLDIGRGENWFHLQKHPWNQNSSAFFWAQLQKEEDQLGDISDAVLLAADEHGKTALHKVSCFGKRALGYAIAKRMVALNGLDLKDADGMTALLYAAKHNHHLMVADLIHLGANVNETNNLGKSCLHLSAEKGYFRVLEVLKHLMTHGLYVDVEAADNSGMSVLQCASLSLKAIVRELENSKHPVHTPLYALHQEQMMETLECLLQMGSYRHTMGSQGIQPGTG